MRAAKSEAEAAASEATTQKLGRIVLSASESAQRLSRCAELSSIAAAGAAARQHLSENNCLDLEQSRAHSQRAHA